MSTAINQHVLKIHEATANEDRRIAFQDAIRWELFTPGPAIALELQSQQSILLSMYYSLKGDDRKWAKTMYDETVKQLIGLLGDDAHCTQVDSEIFSFYSDVYKDINNFRPRFHVTRKEVEAWIKENTTQVEETAPA